MAESTDIDLSLDEIITKRGWRNKSGNNGNNNNTNNNNNNNSGNKRNSQRSNYHNVSHTTQFKNNANHRPAAYNASHPVVVDARNTIVARNRNKISDARDVLQRNVRKDGFDARQRLNEQRQQQELIHHFQIKPSNSVTRMRNDMIAHGRLGNRIIAAGSEPGARVYSSFLDRIPSSDHVPRKRTIGFSGNSNIHIVDRIELNAGGGGGGIYNNRNDSYQTTIPIPRGYVDYDNVHEQEDLYGRSTGLSFQEELAEHTKTRGKDFSNILGRIGKSTAESSSKSKAERLGSIWSEQLISNASRTVDNEIPTSDPFNVYEIRNRNRPPLQTKSSTIEMMDLDDDVDMAYERRPSNISSQLRARLHTNRPDPRHSHGIYANENYAKKLSASAGSSSSAGGAGGGGGGLSINNSSPAGYRIVVSNLHGDVITNDIKELFSEIGPMYDARVVRPGVAEVIYKSLIDAERAVDTYHNRQLDGLAMTCLLVNPRSSNRPTAPAIGAKSTSGGPGSVSCDIDTLHSVLFGER